jgi:hypothetical protein
MPRYLHTVHLILLCVCLVYGKRRNLIDAYHTPILVLIRQCIELLKFPAREVPDTYKASSEIPDGRIDVHWSLTEVSFPVPFSPASQVR